MRPHTNRPAGWEERLAELVERYRTTPFAWGVHDCSTLAAEQVAEVTGKQVLAGLLGSYSTAEEADGILAAYGGMQEAAAHILAEAGIPEIPPAFAQRGDLALVLVGNETPLGIVLGTSIAVAGPEGMAFIQSSLMLRAWAL